MLNMKKSILLVSLLLLTACANQKPFYKVGITTDGFQRDRLTCRQYGMQSVQANGLSGNMFSEMWVRNETIKCLNDLGYSQ